MTDDNLSVPVKERKTPKLHRKSLFLESQERRNLIRPRRDWFFKAMFRKFRALDMSDRGGMVEKRNPEHKFAKEFENVEDFFRSQSAISSSLIANYSEGKVKDAEGKEKDTEKPIFHDRAAEFYISEVAQLRQEIVDIKNRELSSERFALGASVVLAALYFSHKIYHVFILASPIVAIGFGMMRAKEYERNIYEIDCYLRELEFKFSGAGAWANYFFRFRKMENYFHTRHWVWWAILLFYAVSILLGVSINSPHLGGDLLNWLLEHFNPFA